MPFKRNLALQNTPLSKQPSKTQPHIENEDVNWSPQSNLPITRTDKRTRALSLQEMELDDWFLNLHIVLETCTRSFMHKFNMSLVIHFYILGLAYWIWTNPSIEAMKFENPSKWNSYESFDLEHCLEPHTLRFQPTIYLPPSLMPLTSFIAPCLDFFVFEHAPQKLATTDSQIYYRLGKRHAPGAIGCDVMIQSLWGWRERRGNYCIRAYQSCIQTLKTPKWNASRRLLSLVDLTLESILETLD